MNTTPHFLRNELNRFSHVAKSFYSSIVLFSCVLFGFQAEAQTTVPFATTGSWTCPVGVSAVTVECWAGGGAGGGVSGNTSAGGGGAGGSYVKKTSVAVTPGTIYTVTVGKGGLGSNSTGLPGEDSWFQTTGTILAKGGNGGAGTSASNTTATGALAISTGNVGATSPFSYYGGAGGTGGANGASGGGGGSSAGTGSNGNNAVGVIGGIAPIGGGAGVNGSTASADGATNNNIGGGGAGGRTSNGSNKNGGNGGAGKVNISYTQLTYKSQLVSMNLGATNWCAGETRIVQIQIKNTGTATWSDASPDINIGVKWNAQGTCPGSGNWCNYYVKVDAGAVAPNGTGIYNIPVTASNNTGSGYTTPLAAGSNNLTFDVIYEGISAFGDNLVGVGPGNVKFVSASQTIVALPTITKGTNPTVCQGAISANLPFTATTGSPDQYSLDYDAAANIAGFIDVLNGSLPATPIVMALPAGAATGTYSATLTVRNSSSGCTSTGIPAAVTITATPTITFGADPVVCRGTTTASIPYSSTNTPNQYSIDYNPAANTAGFTDIINAALPAVSIPVTIPATVTPGVYTATVTARISGTGCISSSTTITITVLAPTVGVTGSSTICINNTSSLSPASNGTWISNSSGVASVDNFGIVTGISAGSATFTYTETATGCSNTTTAITILGNSTLGFTSAAGSNAQTVCINSPLLNISYLVGGTGTGASVSGLPAGVSSSYNAGTKVLLISGTPTVAGSFSYIVTTTGPCSNTALGGIINVSPASAILLSSAAGTNAQSICTNSSIVNIIYQVSGSANGAGVSGLPQGVSGLYNAGSLTISGIPTVAGTFNYTVTTSGPCSPASTTGTISVRSLPSATFVKTNVSACNATNDGSITISPSGTGPFSYSWSGVTGSGNPASTPYANPGNVSAVNGLPIGFYNVMVSDGSGCSASISAIHIQYAFSAFITNSGSISASCANTGSIILYVNAGVGPYTYSLNGTSFNAANSFNSLAPNMYTAYVKDAAGCVSTKSITVNAAPAIVVSPYVRAASSCAADGSIELYRTGGIPPFSYSLDNVTYGVTNKFTNLSAGNYIGYVKDSKGCIGSQAITITQGSGLSVTVSKTNTSTCTMDGTIQVNVNGGTGPYMYSKNGGSTYQASNSFTGLSASTYAITVKDSKGCMGNLNVTINLNPVLVSANVVNASVCGSNQGSIQLFRTGGVGPYTYSLDGNIYQASSSFPGLLPGTYDGYVKDSKTCIGVLPNIVIGPTNCGSFTRSVPVLNNKTNVVNNNEEKLTPNRICNVSAYPNPTNTGFKVEVYGNCNKKVSITVTDIAGKNVYSYAGNSKQQNFGNDLIPGLYILQLVQGDNIQILKLVKQ